jgi:hypothetical protein
MRKLRDNARPPLRIARTARLYDRRAIAEAKVNGAEVLGN